MGKFSHQKLSTMLDGSTPIKLDQTRTKILKNPSLPFVLDSILLLLDKARLTDSMRLEGWALCLWTCNFQEKKSCYNNLTKFFRNIFFKKILTGWSETSVGYSGRPRYCWVKALKSWYKLAKRLVRVRNSNFLNWAAPRRAAISAFINLSNRNSLNSGSPLRKIAGEGIGGLKWGTSSIERRKRKNVLKSD